MAKASDRAPVGLIATVLLLQIGLGWVLGSIYLVSHNSLYNNGNWVATKTTLAETLMGAQSYYFNLQALAGGRLGLSAWYGFQEVVSEREFDPATVEFAFLLKEGGHLTFEFNRTDRAFNGVRLSASERFPPAVLRSTVEGEFLYKKPVRKLRRAGDLRWHRLLVRFEDDEAFTVFLDGRRLETFPVNVIRPQRIGFRGSIAGVFVRDVRVVSRDGSVFFEDFSKPANWLAARAVAVAATIAAWGLLYLLLRRLLPVRSKTLLFYFLMFGVVLIVVGVLVHGINWHRTKFYPNADERMREVEAAYIDVGSERMTERIESAYEPQPAPGVVRILFVGSSQTRGAGAAKRRHTLVRRTEKLLNERSLPGQTFECLNAAVRGYRIARMRQDLAERWVHWNPDIIVVNAGNNDAGLPSEVWEAELLSIVETARGAGSRLVLIPEANSVERPGANLERLHEVTRAVAAERGLALVDMPRHLARRADDGFLWWDWVHLTSFGQELFAEHLVSELERLELVQLAGEVEERAELLEDAGPSSSQRP